MSEQTGGAKIDEIHTLATNGFTHLMGDELLPTAQVTKQLVKDIKGNPDIVFRSKKICVFIDSDFWHCWQFPRWKKTFKMIFGEIT